MDDHPTLGIIGGSGLYTMPGLKDVEEFDLRRVEYPAQVAVHDGAEDQGTSAAGLLQDMLQGPVGVLLCFYEGDLFLVKIDFLKLTEQGLAHVFGQQGR